MTFDDYLRVEADSGIKHEFVNGQIVAMSGGTPSHARVAANAIMLLGAALRGRPCAVFSSDLRVRVLATDLATYPDATVVCGSLEFDPSDLKKNTVINPRVIVDVLSPSTEDYDRGRKLGDYKQIPSLVEVVLVAHDRREVEVVRRETDGSWSRHIAGDGEMVRLQSLDCELSVTEIYRDPLAAGQ